GGTNTLNVSDVGATAADTNVVIQNNQIAGLAPAVIKYDATSAHSSVAGQFGGGINIRGGSGGNTISVLSTFKSSGPRTITAVYAGAGADHVSASLSAATDGFTVLDGQAGNDTIDASASSLPLTVFGGPGSDTVTGGSGGDTIFGDSGRVYYGKPGG